MASENSALPLKKQITFYILKSLIRILNSFRFISDSQNACNIWANVFVKIIIKQALPENAEVACLLNVHLLQIFIIGKKYTFTFLIHKFVFLASKRLLL